MAKIRSAWVEQQQGSSSGQAVHEHEHEHEHDHDHHLFADQDQRLLPDDQKIIEPEPEPKVPQLALSVMVSDDHDHHHQKKVTVTDHGGGLEKLRVIKILRLFGENIPIYHFHIDDESAKTQAIINFHQRLGLGLNPNPIVQQTTHDDDDDHHHHHKRRKPSDVDDELESSSHAKKPKILGVQLDDQEEEEEEEEEEVGRALVQFDPRRLMMVEGVEEEVAVMFRKKLTASDVTAQQNRLLITKTDSERLLSVLTESEREKVLTATKGDYVRVVATTPNNQEFILHLTKWSGSDAVVLKNQWTKLIDANNLQQGDSIQASAFRLRGQLRLAFTIINN